MSRSDDQRQEIFRVIKEAMLALTPPMVVAKDGPQGLEIIGNVPVPYGSKQEIIPGMYFASAVLRKDMVSFYLFPLYAHADAFGEVAPVAWKCLKGKTCFNFKKPEQVSRREIDALMSRALALWKQEGFVK